MDTSVPESSERVDRGLELRDSAKSRDAKGQGGEVDLRGRVLGDSRSNETC